MTTNKYSPITESASNRMPAREPAPVTPPKAADAAYLYSYEQDRTAEARGVSLPSFQSGGASPQLGFTEKMRLDQDFTRRFAEWQQRYPDGRIVGYHTSATQEIRPEIPPMQHLQSRRRNPTPSN